VLGDGGKNMNGRLVGVGIIDRQKLDPGIHQRGDKRATIAAGCARTLPVNRGEGEHACPCGGAGMPCPWCNVPEKGETPRLPGGFKTKFDVKGWRH
jgi:hypothetical protein